MYEGYGTILITGKTGSGKTCFLIKYLNEVINDENSLFYIMDNTNNEFYEYKDRNNVIYISLIDDFNEMIYNSIKNDKNNKKKYLFINDYSEFRLQEEYHKKVKNLMYNREEYNLDLAMASTNKNSFCNGMKASADMVLNINNWRTEKTCKWEDLF